jgi:hypothetical protein
LFNFFFAVPCNLRGDHTASTDRTNYSTLLGATETTFNKPLAENNFRLRVAAALAAPYWLMSATFTVRNNGFTSGTLTPAVIRASFPQFPRAFTFSERRRPG